MSANDQMLGNVHGGSGNEDGGEGAEPALNLPVGDAPDESREESDEVDNGGAETPIDPSAPPANGAHPLTGLPTEIVGMIAANLDPIAHHSLQFSCKVLFGQADPSPLMCHGEYLQFHRQLEVHSARRLKSLLCAFCNTFKSSTPSKATFTDAQAVPKYGGRRFCIDCGIANGHYDKRDLVVKKQKLFVCGGCKVILPHEKEEKVVTNVVMTKAFPIHDLMVGCGAQITITSGGKRWCKSCRVALAGLGDSSAVKAKTVRLP